MLWTGQTTSSAIVLLFQRSIVDLDTKTDHKDYFIRLYQSSAKIDRIGAWPNYLKTYDLAIWNIWNTWLRLHYF